MGVKVRCGWCKAEVADELTALVDLDGTLTVTCWVCLERGEEAANEGDEDGD